MSDESDSSLFSNLRKRNGRAGGDHIAVISSPGLLGKDVYMQSKPALHNTNQENMHMCKTSEEFLLNFLYKHMK